MEITKRHLPHISNPGDIYFITYRQKGTLKEVWKTDCAPVLDRPELAKIITDSWNYISSKVDLLALFIMPNHVHVVLKLLPGNTLADILWSHKKFTAREVNGALGISGAFWQRESYDRILRQGKLDAAIQYTLLNPVRAGLVPHWQDWPFCTLSNDYNWVMAGL